MAAEFDADRAALEERWPADPRRARYGRQTQDRNHQQVRAAINAAEATAEKVLARNTGDRTEVDKYLKALHGLIGMLDTPAIDVILSGVDKRPEATLGELLAFMDAFNLRFGQATTPRQRTLYQELYPKLVALWAEVAPILAGLSVRQPQATAVADFFSKMDYRDLQNMRRHRQRRVASRSEASPR